MSRNMERRNGPLVSFSESYTRLMKAMMLSKKHLLSVNLLLVAGGDFNCVGDFLFRHSGRSSDCRARAGHKAS